jgi:hypothetical protein
MLRIREVEDKDIIPLAEFLPKGFSFSTKEFWLPLFELWWTANPAFTDQFPRGWILENNASIVGFIGNIPVKFLVRGEVRIAAASNSWYVDPSFRGIFSLGLFMENLKQKSASLFFFKENDDDYLMKLLSRFKFEEYILPKSQKEYIYIIDKKKVGFVFKNTLLHNKMPKFSDFFEYLKRLGSLFFAYLFQKPVVHWNVLPDEAYTTSICISCDDAFFNLWEPHQKTCDVTMSRDTKTLNWLYFSPGRQYKRVVIQCHRSCDKMLAGYMVFDIQKLKPSDAGILKLIDICIENNDTQVLASLTSFAIEMGKQYNASLLVVWANNQETEAYFRSTFTIRRTAKHYRHVRFSDTQEMKLGKDKNSNVCIPMIFPPQ